MRVTIATMNQSHSLETARVLLELGQLHRLYAGLPKRRLASRGLVGPEVVSIPWPFYFEAARSRYASEAQRLRMEHVHKRWFDAVLRKRVEPGDLFIGTSSLATSSGREARRKGAIWVCDRPCSHILTQNRLLEEEYRLHGLRWPGISRAIVERELAEYREADAVLVASSFAERSFVQEHSFPPERLWKVPYGIDLSRFYPDGAPDPRFFDVLFVGQLSLQKGVPYLLEAFDRLEVPNKRLTLVGAEQPGINRYLAPLRDRPDVRITGVLPQEGVRREMSRAHVLVLPSVQDGFGMVTAQAIACGCRVVVSDHCGSADFVMSEAVGEVFPARDVAALRACLERSWKRVAVCTEGSGREGDVRGVVARTWHQYLEDLFLRAKELNLG